MSILYFMNTHSYDDVPVKLFNICNNYIEINK